MDILANIQALAHVDIHRYPWYQGYPHGYPWVPSGYPWDQGYRHGYPWVVSRGYPLEYPLVPRISIWISFGSKDIHMDILAEQGYPHANP